LKQAQPLQKDENEPSGYNQAHTILDDLTNRSEEIPDGLANQAPASPKLGQLDDIIIVDNGGQSVDSSTRQQNAQQATSSSSTGSKAMVDQMLEAYVNKYSSIPSSSTSGIRSAQSSSSSNLKIKIKDNSVVSNTLDEVTTTTTAPTEKVPKLKINLGSQNLLSAEQSGKSKMSSMSEFNFTNAFQQSTSQFLTDFNKNDSRQQMQPKDGADFDEFNSKHGPTISNPNYDDENAMDGLNLGSQAKKMESEVSAASSGTNLIEPLIWKPVCNLNSSSRSNSVPTSPAKVPPIGAQTETGEEELLSSPHQNGAAFDSADKQQQQQQQLEPFNIRTNMIVVDYSSNATAESSSMNVVDSKTKENVSALKKSEGTFHFKSVKLRFRCLHLFPACH
jgi:hypothetical protein